MYIDNPSIQNSVRIALMQQIADHEVLLIDDALSAVEFFIRESPQLVIADTSVAFGAEALNQILSINPRQQSIVLSDFIDCSDPKGCVDCLLNNKKKAMSKRGVLHELLYLIDNFEETPCEVAAIED